MRLKGPPHLIRITDGEKYFPFQKEIYLEKSRPVQLVFPHGEEEGAIPSRIEAADFQLLKTLRRHQAGITSVAWSPGGGYFASAGNDERLLIWNTGSWNLYRSLTARGFGLDLNRIYSLAWKP